MKTMKRVRIFWGIFCIVSMITLVVSVCHEWTKSCCEWWSLVAAGVFYTIGWISTWVFFDDILYAMQLHEENREDELED